MERETRTALGVGAALLALLGLTLAAAALPLRPGLLWALGFSAAKTGLIAWYFMELRAAGSRLRLFAGAGFFWLALLAALGLADYLTRFHPY